MQITLVWFYGVETFLRIHATETKPFNVVRYATKNYVKYEINEFIIMEIKRIFLYVACIVLLINGGKTLWELINFNQISDLNNVANSTAYKIGYVVGMLVEIIVFFGLIKIIYDKFFKEVKTKENALN